MPLLDVALLSVFTVGLYMGVTVLRRYGAHTLTFGLMLLGDALLAAVALAARLWGGESSADVGELLGVVAVGIGFCLIVVPPILRELARRALIRDYLRLARFFVDVRDLLQPAMGSAQERELIDTIIAVRSGRISEAITQLKSARSELEPRARRRLDERIIMTYLYARQWPEAIDQYERLGAGSAGSASLQLLVEMVRAYCEADDLESASELVAHLERSEIRNEPALAFLLNRSRLVFLAFVGRTGAVERLAGPRGPLANMPRDAGAYWSGLARHHAGDRAGAVSSLTDAVKFSTRDKRARELAESALERAKAADGSPRSIPSDVATLADSLTEVVLAAPLAPKSARGGAPRLVGVALRRIPVTATLVVVNLLTFGICWLLFGNSADLGALVRSGANVKSATLGGQYWRWITYQFVHAGWLHLAINAYGLWVLGKITEQLYGSRRVFAIYIVAGVVGGIASTLAGPMTSVGASGAVFGLLGAALIELGVHRKQYPQNWTRSLTGLLLLLTIVNVVVGFVYPMIDQAAHLGGLGAGVILGGLLSKNVPWAKSTVAKTAASGLAVVCIAVILWAGFGLGTDGYGDAIAAEDRVVRAFPSGATAELPASWSQVDGEAIYDANRLALVALRVETNSEPLADAVIRELHAEQHETAKERGAFEKARRVDPLIGSPEPFVSHELVVTTSAVAGAQTYRALVFGRRFGPRVVLGVMYVPENLAGEVAPLFRAVLSSIRVPEQR